MDKPTFFRLMQTLYRNLEGLEILLKIFFTKYGSFSKKVFIIKNQSVKKWMTLTLIQIILRQSVPYLINLF